MAFPTFERLARLYHRRMYELFSGRLWEMIRNPELANDPEFQRAARQVARGMVAQAAKANERTWRLAAHKTMRGREIYRALQAEIERHGFAAELERIAARNAELIRSLPREVAERVTSRARVLHQEGARPAEIERELRRFAGHLSESKIRLIARTELSRAETDLSRERSENIGLTHYQWQTSEDQRVRQSHRAMDGVLVSWSDPPAPEKLIGEPSTLGHYHAGQAPNCRCLTLPLISMDEVRWPAKVHRAGRITRMTRAEFTRAIGVKIAA
jgi:SPP1 gp7 family putative phage head morphogenesis protein